MYKFRKIVIAVSWNIAYFFSISANGQTKTFLNQQPLSCCSTYGYQASCTKSEKLSEQFGNLSFCSHFSAFWLFIVQQKCFQAANSVISFYIWLPSIIFKIIKIVRAVWSEYLKYRHFEHFAAIFSAFWLLYTVKQKILSSSRLRHIILNMFTLNIFNFAHIRFTNLPQIKFFAPIFIDWSTKHWNFPAEQSGGHAGS